jgi:Domain of unknown function (DUF4190)
MYCRHCGVQNGDNNFRCTACGKVIQIIPSVRPAAPNAQSDDSVVMRMLLPIGRSGLAIAAGYAGLFAPLIMPSPVALVLGVLAILDLKRHPEKYGRGRAWFGTIMGSLGTLVLVYMVVQMARS